MASIVAYMYCQVLGDASIYANKYGLPESMGNYHDLIQNASLWLYLEDLSIGFPAPNMPNTVSIGDIMAGQPEEPLPQELEEFLLRSDTTILVSFGSFLDHVPDHFAQKVLRSLSSTEGVSRFVETEKTTNFALKNQKTSKFFLGFHKTTSLLMKRFDSS